MRITGGTLKGRRIKIPKRRVRPTKGIVRGAIFNIIGSHIQNAHILDIFAGSGALGLEALSRGATSCVFIEKKSKVLRENIKNLYPRAQTIHIISSDFRRGVKRVVNKQFNIIFVDPPYHTQYIQKTLALIMKYRLLSNNGVVIVEHHSDEALKVPENLLLEKKKKYGETTVSFITNIRA
jgi:16S rRNA (guanine(966)-N(2))-methyltransferase RsmD